MKNHYFFSQENVYSRQDFTNELFRFFIRDYSYGKVFLLSWFLSNNHSHGKRFLYMLDLLIDLFESRYRGFQQITVTRGYISIERVCIHMIRDTK